MMNVQTKSTSIAFTILYMMHYKFIKNRIYYVCLCTEYPNVYLLF